MVIHHINIPFTDEEYALLQKKKPKDKSWHDFLMDEIVGEEWRKKK